MPHPPKSIFHKLQSFIKRKTSQQYKFNQQFEGGVWGGLKAAGELGRYSIVVGYVGFYCKKARILDLGCGEGILQERLAPLNYSYYLGVDFSDVAIANCKKLEDSTTHFEVGDLNKLAVDGKFDAIIYNESIYYLDDPAAAIKALIPRLNDNGIFIFSIVDKHGKVQTSLWDKINAVLALQETTQVINKEGHSWTVQAYSVKN